MAVVETSGKFQNSSTSSQEYNVRCFGIPVTNPTTFVLELFSIWLQNWKISNSQTSPEENNSNFSSEGFFDYIESLEDGSRSKAFESFEFLVDR